MKRGKILSACVRLRGTRAWEALGEYDADNERDPDSVMLGKASDRQKEAYEASYLKTLDKKA